MPGVFEPAPSGRAKCRGCGKAIAKDTLRFGELYPNPYGEGEATLWFHPVCAALKRPEPLLESLEDPSALHDERDRLEAYARDGIAHRRLPRLNGADRAPTGRARCRSCKEMIAKDAWRFSLVYYEEGRFEPSGFIHARCAPIYFETAAVLDRLPYFSDLSPDDLAAIEGELHA